MLDIILGALNRTRKRLTADENRGAKVLLFILAVFILPLSGFAEESDTPNEDRSQPTKVYFGDTHVHTSNSMDAGVTSFMVGPEEAYRFARGELVQSSQGTSVKLIRPLDFLVVADHAEYMGVWNALRASDPLLLENEVGKRWHDQFNGQAQTPKGDAKGSKGKGAVPLRREITIAASMGKNQLFKSDDFVRSVWERNSEIADRLNNPGVFTALIGYEWTSMPGWNNLHRVLIFKDDAEKTTQVLPFSQFDSYDPEDLWQYMAEYEEKTGGNILAIPHNGNASNGLMFSLETYEGEPLGRTYAETRARWEPLAEITQLKGDSETHPALSPGDEFADFRTWDSGNMSNKNSAPGSGTKEAWMLPHEYVRPALKLGLDLELAIGVNPFKFGVIGSTDSHTGLATIEQDSFIGKRSVIESARVSPAPSKKGGGGIWQWEQVAGGLAAVWSPENTREGLFEAMERKETYATTGPRMTVRFFGGWNYVTEDALGQDLAKTGYVKGVPMGGDLTHGPTGQSPKFLIRAVKDPDGANLDRVQMIKGWRDANGTLHEQVYNAALSDGRKNDANGKAEPVGNTVNVPDASYTNSIGDAELAVVWTDPDFDKDELAFYYVRVLEIPTPRWTAYDAKFYGLKNLPEEVPMVTQERAYTSPIWYSP